MQLIRCNAISKIQNCDKNIISSNYNNNPQILANKEKNREISKIRVQLPGC